MHLAGATAHKLLSQGGRCQNVRRPRLLTGGRSVLATASSGRCRAGAGARGAGALADLCRFSANTATECLSETRTTTILAIVATPELRLSAHVDVRDLDRVVSVAEPVPRWDV